MVLVWMMQLVSPRCQYSDLVVTVLVTLQPVMAAVAARTTIAKRIFLMMMKFLWSTNNRAL